MDSKQGQEVHLKSHTDIQEHFLTRLGDLKEKLEKGDSNSMEPWIQKALQRSVYATLCDCKAEGVEDEARAILGENGARAAHQ